jgi:peptidoglycan/LPS O-acetylase OafA/YrhL
VNKPTSLYLDLIRFLAALTVFIVHANYDRFTGGLPFFWHLASFGNDAVMAFFVLSGFVIAYVASEKETTPREYFASRFARLYSVAVPALILTVLLDWIGSRVNYSLYAGWWFQSDNPIWRFVANLFFVNELWFNSIRPFSNGPYWSLGYEFWYYALFACVHYMQGAFRYLLAGLICLFVGVKILLLLPIWLMGVLVFSVAKHYTISHAAGWMLFIASVVLYVLFRLGGYPHALLEWTINNLGEPGVEMLGWSKHFLSSYLIGALIAVHFIGATVISRQFSLVLVAFESQVRYVAGFTFALYLFHYPCLQFFAAVFSSVQNSALRTSFILGGTVLVVWVLGTITEKKKHDLRRSLLRVYDAASEKILQVLRAN